MTQGKGSKTSLSRRLSVSQVAYGLMALFCLLLILRNSDAAIEYMGRGLTICAHTVIPSLFPFMVISDILVSSGAGEALGRLLAKPMKWLFGLSGAGCAAVVLGSMCGFPVGATTAVGLYDKNVISKKECEHLLTFSNQPSSGFLITAVGASLLGNRQLGLILYLVVLCVSFFVGFVMRFILHPQKGSGTDREHPHFPSGLHIGGIQNFTNAVTHASQNMITVCAYVIFFSAITGTLSAALTEMPFVSSWGFAGFYGFLEMSGGINEAASLIEESTSVVMPLVMIACMAGWSGLSVHAQIMSICRGRGLSFKPYLLAKLMQSILCGVTMAILLQIFEPSDLPPLSETVALLLPTVSSIGYLSPPLSLLSQVGFAAGFVRLLFFPQDTINKESSPFRRAF